MRRLLIASLATGIAAPAAAQSDLVELAKREKERRARLKAETKAYTDADARTAGGVVTVTRPLAPPTEASGKPVESPEAQAEQAKAAWQKRMSDARAAIVTARETLAAREAEYQKVFNDMTPQATPEPDRLQRREARLGELRAAIAAAQKAVADAQQKLASVEEEARRARVPAGWLR